MTEKKEAPAHRDALVDALEKCEAEIQRRLAAHVKACAKLADGHPAHAGHNVRAEVARKQLGIALGGVVSAAQALDAHESIHAEAVAQHAEAEKLKKESGK